MLIKEIKAEKIPDSRGEPTIKITKAAISCGKNPATLPQSCKSELRTMSETATVVYMHPPPFYELIISTLTF